MKKVTKIVITGDNQGHAKVKTNGEIKAVLNLLITAQIGYIKGLNSDEEPQEDVELVQKNIAMRCINVLTEKFNLY